MVHIAINTITAVYNEGVASSLQRFGDCYPIYRHNEQLLDAHTHTHTHTVTYNTGCLSEGYASYSNDKTTCCRPPVCNVEGRSQHRKMTARMRELSIPSVTICPSLSHPSSPSPSFNCHSFISLLLSFFIIFMLAFLPWIFSRAVFFLEFIFETVCFQFVSEVLFNYII